VDNQGKKADLTMAYVGTRKLFEDAGFTKAADTDSVSGGFPRVMPGPMCGEGFGAAVTVIRRSRPRAARPAPSRLRGLARRVFR